MEVLFMFGEESFQVWFITSPSHSTSRTWERQVMLCQRMDDSQCIGDNRSVRFTMTQRLIQKAQLGANFSIPLNCRLSLLLILSLFVMILISIVVNSITSHNHSRSLLYISQPLLPLISIITITHHPFLYLSNIVLPVFFFSHLWEEQEERRGEERRGQRR